MMTMPMHGWRFVFFFFFKKKINDNGGRINHAQVWLAPFLFFIYYFYYYSLLFLLDIFEKNNT